MKIVIDISKDDFEKIKNTSFVENTETMLHQSSEDRKGTMMLFRVMDAIKEGTPLPKEHGRIKDIDKIEWYGCTTEFDCPHKDRECKDCDRAECNKTQVDAIPTIIEGSDSE